MNGCCNGTCCAVFVMNKPLAEIVANVDGITDGPYIVDMLRRLTSAEAAIRCERYGLTPFQADELFTCRHWNEATMMCLAYDKRPGMCRNYPYGKECTHQAGCTGAPREAIIR